VAKLKWHDAMVAVNEAHIDSHEAMMAAEAAELEKKLLTLTLTLIGGHDGC